MIDIEIPGFGQLKIKHIVLDYNGTLAVDGELLDGVRERLIKLGRMSQIHVLTADTFGKAASQLNDVPCKLHILEKNNEDFQKEKYVKNLGCENVVAIGNGNNDSRMLRIAKLGIAVIGYEGCAKSAIQSADVIITDINHGLEFLLNAVRCKATLRF